MRKFLMMSVIGMSLISGAAFAQALAGGAAAEGISISRSFTETVGGDQTERAAVEKIYGLIAAECDSAAKSFKKKCTPGNINISSQGGTAGPDGKPTPRQVNATVTLQLRD